MPSALIIHGGLHKHEGSHVDSEGYAKALQQILDASYEVLQQTSAGEAVLTATTMLEDNPVFNAGTGSKIQRDGKIRMSAAMMDPIAKLFSGVVNVRNVQNPIKLCANLRREKHNVLGGDEATEYAFKNGYKYYDPMTKHRVKEFLKMVEADVEGETGTVGVVALDSQGKICVGTSTGGIGNETAGRISDSATVAGTYASREIGVSCTGRGEDIIRYAVAARVVAFHQSGMSGPDAAARIMNEIGEDGGRFGFIGLTSEGVPIAVGTEGTSVMYAFKSKDRFDVFTQTPSLGT